MLEIGFDGDAVERTEAPAPRSAPDPDWRLLEEGLEHRASGYFIARDEIAHRRGDGLWTWPMQLAEKAWCAPVGFRRTFLAALERYGVSPDAALDRSFALGFGLHDPGQRQNDRFVALGEVVRPRHPDRKRAATGEPRRTVRERPRQGVDTRILAHAT
ncbi:hypothetical protein [Methylobacterium sp. Leaf118]|uniref:hypothetical protein n=1 Tax=Methylobacterium sp. Leaf118 TaxID=2876562 RepID=UPI001E61ECC2|nr:hypothetical protein [Methylobacterium sp. Leaf118]